MEYAMKKVAHGMTRRGTAIATIVLGCLGSLGAHAADSTITVTGEVYAEPCTVSSGASLSLALGRVSAKDFQAANSSSASWSTPVNITLTNCPSSTRSVTAKFEGTADTDDANKFKNGGTAKNLAVWLGLVRGGSTEDIAPADEKTIAVASGGAEFPVAAKLFSKKGGAESGSVTSTISVTLSYN